MRTFLFSMHAAAASVVLEDATAQLQMRKVHVDEDIDVDHEAKEAIAKVAEEAKEAISKLAEHHASKHAIPHWKPSSASLLSHATKVSTSVPVHIPLPDYTGTVEMERESVDAYPLEFHASIPMGENGIATVTNAIPGLGDTLQCGTCGMPDAVFSNSKVTACTCVEFAVFPMNHHYTGISAKRNTPSTGREEIGELRWIADIAGEVSVMPGTKIGFAERFFIKEHTGTWEATENHVYNASEDAAASAQVPLRIQKLATQAGASGLIDTLMAATMDPLWAHGLTPHLKSNVYTADSTAGSIASEAGGLHSWVEELTNDPISIATSCIHFLDHGLVIPMPGSQVALMPIGINLPVGRAQTNFYPTYSISASYGVGSFHKSSDNSRLFFHMGASAFSEFQIQRSGYGTATPSATYVQTPKLYLSAYDGDGPAAHIQLADLRAAHPKLAEFNTNRLNPVWMGQMNHLFKEYAQMNMSYGYLYQNMDEVCNSTTLHNMQLEASQLDFWAMLIEGGGLNTTESMQLMGHAVHTLPCGLSFLRGAVDHSNGYDVLEHTVWAHFLMEWPKDHRMNGVRGSTTEEHGWHWKHMPTTATAVDTAATAVDTAATAVDTAATAVDTAATAVE